MVEVMDAVGHAFAEILVEPSPIELRQGARLVPREIAVRLGNLGAPQTCGSPLGEIGRVRIDEITRDEVIDY
jgi:hypothetical protein